MNEKLKLLISFTCIALALADMPSLYSMEGTEHDEAEDLGVVGARSTRLIMKALDGRIDDYPKSRILVKLCILELMWLEIANGENISSQFAQYYRTTADDVSRFFFRAPELHDVQVLLNDILGRMGALISERTERSNSLESGKQEQEKEKSDPVVERIRDQWYGKMRDYFSSLKRDAKSAYVEAKAMELLTALDNNDMKALRLAVLRGANMEGCFFSEEDEPLICSPIYLAVIIAGQTGDTSIADWLFEHGADVNRIENFEMEDGNIVTSGPLADVLSIHKRDAMLELWAIGHGSAPRSSRVNVDDIPNSIDTGNPGYTELTENIGFWIFGNEKEIEALIKLIHNSRESDPLYWNSFIRQGLVIAAAQGRLGVMQRIVSELGSYLDEKSINTAFRRAASSGYNLIVDFLLNTFKTIISLDSLAHSFLVAAAQGRDDVVENLICIYKGGVSGKLGDLDANTFSDFEKHYASMKENPDDQGLLQEAFTRAVLGDHLRVIKMILDFAESLDFETEETVECWRRAFSQAIFISGVSLNWPVFRYLLVHNLVRRLNVDPDALDRDFASELDRDDSEGMRYVIERLRSELRTTFPNRIVGFSPRWCSLTGFSRFFGSE